MRAMKTVRTTIRADCDAESIIFKIRSPKTTHQPDTYIRQDRDNFTDRRDVSSGLPAECFLINFTTCVRGCMAIYRMNVVKCSRAPWFSENEVLSRAWSTIRASQEVTRGKTTSTAIMKHDTVKSAPHIETSQSCPRLGQSLSNRLRSARTGRGKHANISMDYNIKLGRMQITYQSGLRVQAMWREVQYPCHGVLSVLDSNLQLL